MASEETLRDSSQTQSDTSQAAKTDLSEPAGSSAQVESPDPSVNPFAPDDGRRVSKEEYYTFSPGFTPPGTRPSLNPTA
ncbi:MAG: hypothetical protein OXG26_01030 [Caldilineaceae bacterium]|nr:hypothetical protein [Caldilineaceae bacterium]